MDTIEECRKAWVATKPEHAPEYDDLEQSYRDMLTQKAEAIFNGEYVSDGPFGSFERTILDSMRRQGGEPPKLKGKLPSDFPALSQLDEAGIHTYTQLSKVDDLTEIKGIGPATAEKIKERLNAAQ